MEIKEDLIQEALLKSQPEDLDDLLTAIEAYRICARTAGKLDGAPAFRSQRTQATECAEYCERILADYSATGRLKKLRYPERDFGSAHFNVEMG